VGEDLEALKRRVPLLEEGRVAPMWDDPSLQVRVVGFLSGMAARCIVVGEFALNKVIAQLREGSLAENHGAEDLG
jgi:hypothetical protein